MVGFKSSSFSPLSRPVTHWTEGRMAPRVGLYDVENDFFVSTENPTPAVQTVDCHTTD
jgi:hypothetical protein